MFKVHELASPPQHEFDVVIPSNDTVSCTHCERLGRVLGHYADENIAHELALADTTTWLSSAFKVTISTLRALDGERFRNRMLADEVQYLRDTLGAEREIRTDGSRAAIDSEPPATAESADWWVVQ